METPEVLALISAPREQSVSRKDVDLAKEWTGGYEVTSAPAIYKDLVITGSSIADNWKVDTERGIVRAFDVAYGQTTLDMESDSMGRSNQAAHGRCKRLVHTLCRCGT